MQTTVMLNQAMTIIKQLSLAEQLRLLEWLIQQITNLFKFSQTSPQMPPSFWQAKSLAEHIQEQHGQPITDLNELAMSSWPPDQTADDFIAFTQTQRQLGEQNQ